ncbi:hypothetical protein J0A67_03155 [Algoriphagus aestuariicola]|uniref:Baseplate protein J-like domain-containing protein n=1 Tax=Algoriphagus aestuariicola TaxID=1852016 RepID=A0ABS3BKL8_9BACT|nr:hypothetical protein [Algoriphagus aestuariicola]MBN7799839.1 hypothetical protein [Algoriphagus aestuariicola]
MKNGINQSGRLLPSLEPTSIVPDERTLLDLVQFTLDYSDAVSYYNFQNKPLGTWRPFLLDDPVFITGLVAAASFDSYKLRQDDLAVKAENRTRSRKEHQEAMAANLLSMVKHLLHWESLFRDCNYSGPLMKEIMNSKKFLEPMVQGVFHYQKRFNAFEFSGMLISEKRETQEVNFNESFKAVYKNLVFVVELAGRRFNEMIEDNSGGHQPHIGLLLAALRLFKEVQADMNSLTRRHLDFYYQRILQQVPKSPTMLQVLIGLIPKSGADLLPKNSTFSLLFPSKKVISMRTQLDTELSPARVVDIRTLYKSNYFPFSSGLKNEKFALNGVYSTVLYQGQGKNEIVFSGDTSSDFPVVMGEDQSQKGLNQRTMGATLIGLVVSSPVLFVEMGKHYFQLTFELTRQSCSAFKDMLAKLLREKEVAMGSGQQRSDHALRSFIYSFLNEAFTVALTTATGWKALEFVQVNFLEAESRLEFKLELDGMEDFPVAYDQQLHGGIAGTDWPCIRLLLNNAAHYPPYRPIQELEVVEVEILTLSKGVSMGFECSNQIGKLDCSNPFLPFGALPSKDSYLRVFDPLIFNKYLLRLSVKLTWLGFPDERTGFTGHYKSYPEEINNRSFRATVSIDSFLVEQSDVTRLPEQKVLLFGTKEKSDGEYLLKSKVIDLNLDLVDRTILGEPSPKVRGRDNPVYFELKLSDPSPFAFGHDKYAQLYAETSFHNSRFPKRPRELPKPAYTPQVERVEFSYSNYAKENLGRKGSENSGSIKIFHLFPFGFSQVFPASGKALSYLVPQLNRKGNLLIGLTDVSENQFLNLGFKLHPAFFIHTVTHPPRVAWEYLERNTWVPLGNLMLEDSTHGMLQSGIVKIKLPSRMDFNSTRLDSGKFWLRISNSGYSDINSRLIAIFTNATWATQVPDESTMLSPHELRDELTVVSNGNPAINSVAGPYHIKVPTFKKTPAQDRSRISEMMRHRNRGISTWDLERIVLETFPQIGRVMVYGRSDFPLHLVKNSNVQVVVIPHSPLESEFGKEGFRAPFELLQEIKQYLHAFVSPFTRLEVCNPVFEKLKIRAAVKFHKTQQSGYYRNLLERELIEFLSPNPGDFQEEKGFINSVFKAEIQSFIESRPYVDFITGLSVLQIVEVQGSYKIIDTADTKYRIEQLRTISPYAILTSAESHQLEVIQDSRLLDPEIASIGDLSIDTDFIIKQSKK